MDDRTQPHKLLHKLYFYQRKRVVTEVADPSSRTLLVAEEHLLAQLRRDANVAECALMATDIKRTVLEGCLSNQCESNAYLPFGFYRSQPGLSDLPAFNGELMDAQTAHYFLGAGYRVYNTVLMRFQSPDSWSPFGAGGINAYAFVQGDPVNRVDPSGHMWRRAGRKKWSSKRAPKPGAGHGSPEHTPSASRRGSNDSSRSSVPSVPNSRKNSTTSLGIGQSSSRSSSPFASEPGDPGESRTWTYSSTKAKFHPGLTDKANEKFATFEEAISVHDLSPKDAAKKIGDADYKLLDKNTNLYQIRLNHKDRVTFTIDDYVVEIRQVGGHS